MKYPHGWVWGETTKSTPLDEQPNLQKTRRLRVVSAWHRDQDDLGTSSKEKEKKEKEEKESQRPKIIPEKDEVMNEKEMKMFISTRECEKRRLEGGRQE